MNLESIISELEECLELLGCVGTNEKCKRYVADALEFLKAQEEQERPCEMCQEFVCDGCAYKD